MKNLFALADRFVAQSTWKDYALVKLCLGSMGVMIGTRVPEKDKKKAVAVAGGIFALTYVPLMAKVIRLANKK